ncbi:MAG: 2'-5' RNA ligase family protein [Flavobacteriales bacterium]|nr:2'-5' RNA ligase family protein [Flavobacteriales bacterium]
MAKPEATESAPFETESTLHRFLLVIHPHAALTEQVEEWKDLLASHIGYFSGRHSIPHITLFVADLPGTLEAAVIKGITAGAVGHRSFALHYDGITHFPDRKTIYVAPVQKEAIAPVRSSVACHVRSTIGSNEAVMVTNEPHLTIAAGLKAAQFDKAWDLLAPHIHRSDQTVDELLLLRREMRPGARYDVVQPFKLTAPEPTLF